jgi:hypothetical protein
VHEQTDGRWILRQLGIEMLAFLISFSFCLEAFTGCCLYCPPVLPTHARFQPDLCRKRGSVSSGSGWIFLKLGIEMLAFLISFSFCLEAFTSCCLHCPPVLPTRDRFPPNLSWKWIWKNIFGWILPNYKNILKCYEKTPFLKSVPLYICYKFCFESVFSIKPTKWLVGATPSKNALTRFALNLNKTFTSHWGTKMIMEFIADVNSNEKRWANMF